MPLGMPSDRPLIAWLGECRDLERALSRTARFPCQLRLSQWSSPGCAHLAACIVSTWQGWATEQSPEQNGKGSLPLLTRSSNHRDHNHQPSGTEASRPQNPRNGCPVRFVPPAFPATGAGRPVPAVWCPGLSREWPDWQLASGGVVNRLGAHGVNGRCGRFVSPLHAVTSVATGPATVRLLVRPERRAAGSGTARPCRRRRDRGRRRLRGPCPAPPGAP